MRDEKAFEQNNLLGLEDADQVFFVNFIFLKSSLYTKKKKKQYNASGDTKTHTIIRKNDQASCCNIKAAHGK